MSQYEIMYLRELYNWSLNGHSCWVDFLSIAHNDFEESDIDFTTYGYMEKVLFGKCLTIFENNGYDEATRLIDEVLEEYKQEEE